MIPRNEAFWAILCKKLWNTQNVERKILCSKFEHQDFNLKLWVGLPWISDFLSSARNFQKYINMLSGTKFKPFLTQAKKIMSWAGLLGIFSSNWARGRISTYVGPFFIHILKSWAAGPKASSQVGSLGWISAFSAKVGLFWPYLSGFSAEIRLLHLKLGFSAEIRLYQLKLGFFGPQLSLFSPNKVSWYIILFQSETLVLFVKHQNILRHLILQVWEYAERSAKKPNLGQKKPHVWSFKAQFRSIFMAKFQFSLACYLRKFCLGNKGRFETLLRPKKLFGLLSKVSNPNEFKMAQIYSPK
jgi:hypothetical protein